MHGSAYSRDQHVPAYYLQLSHLVPGPIFELNYV